MTKMEGVALESCPFCGADAAEYMEYSGFGNMIECTNCTAQGAAARDKAEATAAWNRRSASGALAKVTAEPVAWTSRHDHSNALRQVSEGWVPDIGWSAPSPVYATHPAADRDRLAADLAEARKVIEPFAKEAGEWNSFDEEEILVEGWARGPNSSIKVSHLRAAAAFIGKGGE